MSAEDPYALHADGTAVDPRLFREAALADASLAEDLRKDERASGVLASGDDAALQELLKEVHHVRCFVFADEKKRRGDGRGGGGGGGGGGGTRRRRVAVERERDSRSNCSCLFLLFSFVRSFFRPLPSSQPPSPLSLARRRRTKQNKQEESRRAERESRAMSERTIDAQRASAPVPR